MTTFADGDVDTDVLTLDPGVAVRLAVSAEYAATRGVSLYGGVAGSWPEADVAVNGVPRADINMSVYELSVGALFRLGEWAAGTRLLPFYVGGDANLVFHSFDNLFWEGELTDVTTTSVGLRGKFGVGYPIGPKLMLRGEGKLHIVRGGLGGLEQALGKGPISNAMIGLYVLWDFVLGIFIVWLYAAIRPRYGAGPGTAVLAGLAAWFLVFLLHSIGEAPLDLFPLRLYVIITLVGALQMGLAGVAGGWVYQEEGGGPAS